MKYLYNEKEILRYVNVAMFIFFLIYIVVLANKLGIEYVIREALTEAVVILSIGEAFVLCFWYPDEVRRKKALAEGIFYNGRIVDVSRKRTKHIITNTQYIYTITVEFYENGKNKTVELGEYAFDPSEYLPDNRKCKVYTYKGKYYFEKFVFQKKNKIEEKVEDYELLRKRVEQLRDSKYSIKEIETMTKDEAYDIAREITLLATTKSKECLYYLPLVFFRIEQPYGLLFLEVHIESKKSYNGVDFDVSDEVSKFMETRIICDIYPKEQFINDLKEMVKIVLESRANKLKVLDVIVVLK